MRPPNIQANQGRRICERAFEHGVPTKESMTKLYDEMDFQRAVQAMWKMKHL